MQCTQVLKGLKDTLRLKKFKTNTKSVTIFMMPIILKLKYRFCCKTNKMTTVLLWNDLSMPYIRYINKA